MRSRANWNIDGKIVDDSERDIDRRFMAVERTRCKGGLLVIDMILPLIHSPPKLSTRVGAAVFCRPPDWSVDSNKTYAQRRMIGSQKAEAQHERCEVHNV